MKNRDLRGTTALAQASNLVWLEALKGPENVYIGKNTFN